MRKTMPIIFLIFLLLIGTASADGLSGSSKLDPMLTLINQGKLSINIAKSLGVARVTPSLETRVQTIVRFKGDLSGIEALGGEIGAILGDIATVDLPLNALAAVSQLPNIIYVEAAKKMKPRLDVSVPETGASLLRSGTPPVWTGFTGKGVVIGIVDTGIDLNHPDFKDPSGNTRILYLLDQTTGEECTNTTIDAGTCNQTDDAGHGTHVAGIAGGNGSAENYTYVGMTPEADLIIVKTDFVNILDGINYIQSKANSLGKPSVINLSLGGHIDPHDGTSNFSKGLDNASGPGKIIVVAAGNEAADNIHTSGYVPQDSQTPRDFDVPSGLSAVVIDIWYPGSDNMSVGVVTPSCGDTGWVDPGTTNFELSTACGTIYIFSELNNPNNGDNEIGIVLQNPVAGTWSFSLYGNSITDGIFDAWNDEKVTFVTPDTSMTLTDVGVTTRVVSVGSYVTWRNSIDDPDVGDISSFSSLGPRRLCSICDYVRKPDIAAPGQWIYSAKANGPEYYTLMQGTSMAAPHVTGAVALMLQANATLTPEEIKSYIFNTAKTDSYTGGVPNDTWGYGKLDAYTSVLSVLPAAPSGLTAIAVSSSQIDLSWTDVSNEDGYKIERKTGVNGTYSEITTVSANTTTYSDTGLSASTTYYYRVKAYNLAGDSEYSNEASATTSAPPSSDDGDGGGGGGCFIATAAYGSLMHPYVSKLREFRDRHLLNNYLGKAFVEFYYKHSPGIADVIRNNETLKATVRVMLFPVVMSVVYPYTSMTVFIAFLVGGVVLLRRFKSYKKKLALLAVVGCIFLFAGCATPQFKTFTTYGAPESSEGKLCIMQCKNTKLMCDNVASLEYRSCQQEVKAEAQQSLMEAMEEYNKKYERYRECMSDPENYYCAEPIMSRPKLSDFTGYSNCKKDTEACLTSYDECFELCGGKITRVTKCVKNCEKLKK